MKEDEGLAKIERRERQVLGSGPRIPALKPDEMTDETLAFNRRISKIATRDKREFTLETVPVVIATMMRHPKLFQLQTDVGLFLIAEGELPARLRELLILRIAWLAEAPYEWGEHVLFAHRVGITAAETEAVTEGSAAPKWTADERAILRAVEELHAGAMISDETWAALASYLSERQLMEIPLLVGQYLQIAFFHNALRIPLHEGNAGLRAR